MREQTKRIVERTEILGSISDDNHCLSRFYGTPAHKKAGEILIQWMENAGMKVTKDHIGNIRGILHSTNTNAKHFVIGSHYDTVFNAGNYDGPLGILLGLEVAQRIYEKQITLPFHLNIVAFADEEGSRFNTAYLGSAGLIGQFDNEWLNRQDDNGAKLGTVISENGGDITNLCKDCINEDEWLGYFEAHIEQGPLLCVEDSPVCLVSSIKAQTRVNLKWIGVSGHAGTYPMHLRNDAFCAAAEFALEVEKIGKTHKENLVATIGKFNVEPNTSNVIPGLVTHSLDLRSADDRFLAEITEKLKQKASLISQNRDIGFEWEIMQTNASVNCDNNLKKMLGNAIKKANINNLLETTSGAGHDAVMVSKVAPVSMLFIRCKDGVSHNPLEFTATEDIEQALNVCENFVDELIEATKNKK